MILMDLWLDSLRFVTESNSDDHEFVAVDVAEASKEHRPFMSVIESVYLAAWIAYSAFFVGG
jgi:hypothetical protein